MHKINLSARKLQVMKRLRLSWASETFAPSQCIRPSVKFQSFKINFLFFADVYVLILVNDPHGVKLIMPANVTTYLMILRNQCSPNFLIILHQKVGFDAVSICIALAMNHTL